MGCSSSLDKQTPAKPSDIAALDAVAAKTTPISTNDSTPTNSAAVTSNTANVTATTANTSSSSRSSAGGSARSPTPPRAMQQKKPSELNIRTGLVNIVPMGSYDDASDEVQEACFGAGAYWGTEKFFRELAGKKITLGVVGFMGSADATPNPTYNEVCNGKTDHVQVYKITFRGGADVYRELVRFFFTFHDPTTPESQGNDKGRQFASVIYCYTDEQVKIAVSVKDELQRLVSSNSMRAYEGSKVVTDILFSTTFYPAAEEHQNYLFINPKGYCNHSIRFDKWPRVTSTRRVENGGGGGE